MNILVVVIALLLSFGCPTAMAQSGRSGNSAGTAGLLTRCFAALSEGVGRR